MKTNRDEILMAALRLFGERGFDAVSTSMIAGELGITKGALYRHFANKQAIFDGIVEKMVALDAQRARADRVPEKVLAEDGESYPQTGPEDLLQFQLHQFAFWTGDPFAVAFRRMVTLEQFKSPAMSRLYQEVIAGGPVQYSADILQAAMDAGKLKPEAKALGACALALSLFAPMQLAIQLADGGADPGELTRELEALGKEFLTRWVKTPNP